MSGIRTVFKASALVLIACCIWIAAAAVERNRDASASAASPAPAATASTPGPSTIPETASVADVPSAGTADSSAQDDGHIEPTQSVAAAYTTTTDMRFRSINYTSMICTDPRYAVRANLIASGLPVTGDPNTDAAWMQTQRENKNCMTMAPNIAFHVTEAFAVYAGDAGAIWVVGVKRKDGSIAGFIPVDAIQFIPIPTL